MVEDGMGVIANDTQRNEGSPSAFSQTMDFALCITQDPVASIPLTLKIFEDIIPKILLVIL